jgi:hypothetical protein
MHLALRRMSPEGFPLVPRRLRPCRIPAFGSDDRRNLA